MSTLTRLTLVELRKATDTRAGVWLLATIAALSAAVVALQLEFGDDRTLSAALATAQQPISTLTPVLGLLLVTSEWSQRTALSTFTLVPARERVVAAKLVAASLLSLATTVWGLLAAFAGFALLRPGAWHLAGCVPAQLALVNWLTMMFGTAFGLLLLRSAPTIVVYYAVPLAWTFLGRIVPGLQTGSRWVDVGQARVPLTDPGVTAHEWTQLLTSALLWIALPGLAGILRIRRTEIT